MLALAALVAGALASAAGGAVGGVSIVARAYQPSALTVGTGQTVTWRNESLSQHTVTAADGLFDSGVLDSGGSFSVTFAKAGTFAYSCMIHPTMHGTVTVLAVPAGTVAVRLTTRRTRHGAAVVLHVQAASAGAQVVAQTAAAGGAWRTAARSRLSAGGLATLTLTGAAHRRIRVVVAAAAGAPRLVSRVLRAPA
jgi:plastocyanin